MGSFGVPQSLATLCLGQNSLNRLAAGSLAAWVANLMFEPMGDLRKMSVLLDRHDWLNHVEAYVFQCFCDLN